jgi:hypothetical protein
MSRPVSKLKINEYWFCQTWLCKQRYLLINYSGCFFSSKESLLTFAEHIFYILNVADTFWNFIFKESKLVVVLNFCCIFFLSKNYMYVYSMEIAPGKFDKKINRPDKDHALLLIYIEWVCLSCFRWHFW